jgi:hypothetical protein
MCSRLYYLRFDITLPLVCFALSLPDATLRHRGLIWGRPGYGGTKNVD